jgi:hypothetical protein
MLAKAQIFSPLRQFVIRRTKPGAPARGQWKWVNNLLGCPFCVSVWLAAGAVLVYQPRVIREWYPVDLLTETLAISGASMLVVLVIKKALAT